MLKKSPRVVSLVPSWTETLVAAGVDVVGCTRFCIHPAQNQNRVKVGGTKSVELKIVNELKPDFILLDQQENTKEMAEELMVHGHKLVVTNVTDFVSVQKGCQTMGEAFENSNLSEMAERYLQIQNEKIDRHKFIQDITLKGSWDLERRSAFEYVIWKKPFMVIGAGTFISENLKLIDIDLNRSEKYPKVDEQDLQNKFCLFSSEPFPFLKKYDELLKEGYQGVVVDGEKLSWFGLRNLQFLESCLK